MKPTIKVFYNSACPVCNAGIQSQKNKVSSCGTEWKDVHLDHDLVKELKADIDFVRKRLHVIDENGQLQVGFNAFITIWKHSPTEHWKAKVSSLPIIHQLLNMGYNMFAWALFKWNQSKKRW